MARVAASMAQIPYILRKSNTDPSYIRGHAPGIVEDKRKRWMHNQITITGFFFKKLQETNRARPIHHASTMDESVLGLTHFTMVPFCLCSGSLAPLVLTAAAKLTRNRFLFCEPTECASSKYNQKRTLGSV